VVREAREIDHHPCDRLRNGVMDCIGGVAIVGVVIPPGHLHQMHCVPTNEVSPTGDGVHWGVHCVPFPRGLNAEKTLGDAPEALGELVLTGGPLSVKI
jgi:hypothetical protein